MYKHRSNQAIYATGTSYGLKLGAHYTNGVGAYSSIQSTEFYSGSEHVGNLSLQPLGGNVGIGTQSPLSALHVYGSTTIGNWGRTDSLTIYSNSSQPLMFGNSAGPYDWHVGPDNSGAFRIVAGGSGSGGGYGGVALGWAASAWGSNSDIRLKKDIEPLTNTLSTIMALRPVSFNWIKSHSPSAPRTLGLIAQEVMEVLPEIVFGGKSDTDFYAITYTEIIPVLIGAVKEQQSLIVSQQEQMKAVETSLAVLEAKSESQSREISELKRLVRSLLG